MSDNIRKAEKMSSIIKETVLGVVQSGGGRERTRIMKVEWDDGEMRYEARGCNGYMSRRNDLSSLLGQIARHVSCGWYGKRYKIIGEIEPALKKLIETMENK